MGKKNRKRIGTESEKNRKTRFKWEKESEQNRKSIGKASEAISFVLPRNSSRKGIGKESDKNRKPFLLCFASKLLSNNLRLTEAVDAPEQRELALLTLPGLEHERAPEREAQSKEWHEVSRGARRETSEHRHEHATRRGREQPAVHRRAEREEEADALAVDVP